MFSKWCHRTICRLFRNTPSLVAFPLYSVNGYNYFVLHLVELFSVSFFSFSLSLLLSQLKWKKHIYDTSEIETATVTSSYLCVLTMRRNFRNSNVMLLVLYHLYVLLCCCAFQNPRKFCTHLFSKCTIFKSAGTKFYLSLYSFTIFVPEGDNTPSIYSTGFLCSPSSAMLSWQNCNFASPMPMFFCICNGKHNYFYGNNYMHVAVVCVFFFLPFLLLWLHATFLVFCCEYIPLSVLFGWVWSRCRHQRILSFIKVVFSTRVQGISRVKNFHAQFSH